MADARWRLGGQGAGRRSSRRGSSSTLPVGLDAHRNALQTAPGRSCSRSRRSWRRSRARASLLRMCSRFLELQLPHAHGGEVAERDGRPRAETGGALPDDAARRRLPRPGGHPRGALVRRQPPCAAAYRPGDKLGEAAATHFGGNGEDAGRRCVARLAATMDAALALEDATFVDYNELPGAIDDIAARFGLPTVNASRVAGVDAKAGGGAYDESRAATKRAGAIILGELWAWAAPHLRVGVRAMRCAAPSVRRRPSSSCSCPARSRFLKDADKFHLWQIRVKKKNKRTSLTPPPLPGRLRPNQRLDLVPVEPSSSAPALYFRAAPAATARAADAPTTPSVLRTPSIAASAAVSPGLRTRHASGEPHDSTRPRPPFVRAARRSPVAVRCRRLRGCAIA